MPWIVLNTYYCAHSCFYQPKHASCFPLSKSQNHVNLLFTWIHITCQARKHLKIKSMYVAFCFQELWRFVYSWVFNKNRNLKWIRLHGRLFYFSESCTIVQVSVTSFFSCYCEKVSRLDTGLKNSHYSTKTCEHSGCCIWAVPHDM